MSGRSKRKFVSLNVKLKTLKRLHKGETLKKKHAAEYGVGELAVGDWRRNRDKIEMFSSNKCLGGHTKKSWNKILQDETDTNNTDEDDLPLAELMKKLAGCENANESEVSEWMDSDEQFEVTDVVEMISERAKDSGDEELPEEILPVITHTEGLAVLDVALRYIEQQSKAIPTDTMLLRRWCDIAAKKRGSILKQRTLDNFFKM
ncbi:hypothetical protein ANN_08594 [Periplaneta americana]|uniref:Uncharacterized protein n=1 Tax=Periplaneta americana TaxID=6978 RepID=A0ABQ8T2I0_PERAM|nr:hypothetical protein ANN_08594 [Periplaneta americana]